MLFFNFIVLMCDLISILLQVPAYVAVQILGSTLASGTLRLIFEGTKDHFPGTLVSGSFLQGFVVEFIITFYLMFVISGVATDNRAVMLQNVSFFMFFCFWFVNFCYGCFCRMRLANYFYKFHFSLIKY